MTLTMNPVSFIEPAPQQRSSDKAPHNTERLSPAAFDATHLEPVFNTLFAHYNTRLQGGAAEPLYQPALVEGDSHTLFYREDFFASALHETAHWCIAGEARRAQVDFGYWYAPDGRDTEAQRAFEDVEVKPQALEWFFSLACGYPFRVSVDNLSAADGSLPDVSAFEMRVATQARHWQHTGLPARALAFFNALSERFATGQTVQNCDFSLRGPHRDC